jgi:hypothetical protein
MAIQVVWLYTKVANLKETARLVALFGESRYILPGHCYLCTALGL